IRTGAARVGCLANAPDWRQRPVDQPNDGAKFYPAHRACKGVTAELSASAFHVSGRLELHKNLLEKFDRQFFFRRQLAYLEHWPAKFGGDAEIDKSSERVFATFREFHLSLLWVHASLSVTSILAAFAAEKVGCGEQNRSARHAHE